MSHVIKFQVSLTCTNCGSLNDARDGALYTSGLGQDPVDTYANPGDILELENADFEEGYFTLRKPAVIDTPLIALEIWGCRVCHRVQFARLAFERVDAMHLRFTESRVVPLSRPVLEEAHFISRSLEEWAPNPGDDADRVWAIVRRFERCHDAP